MHMVEMLEHSSIIDKTNEKCNYSAFVHRRRRSGISARFVPSQERPMDKSRIRRAVSTVYRFLNSIADPFLFHPVGKLVLLLTIAATFAISVERRFEVGELSRITAPLQHYGCDYTVPKETGAVSIGYCEDYPLPITYYIGDAAQERLVQHIVSDMAPLLDDEERASIQWMLKNQASLNSILLHAQHED